MPSFEKNKSSGLWSCRFRETDELGAVHQRRLSGYATKKDAQYAYEDYIKAWKEREEAKKSAQEAERLKGKQITFGELFLQYMEYLRARVKPSTLYDTEQKVNARILPTFSHIRVIDITALDMLRWQQSVSVYSYRYQKNLHSYISAIFSYGEKYHELPNVMRSVDGPRNLEPVKEMKVWTVEQFEAAIKHEKKPEYEMLFRTLFTLGCRRGEALALGWGDVDFKNNIVSITKSVTFKSSKKQSGDRYDLTTPKNKGSVRKVIAPPSLIERLKEYKKWQEKKCGDATFIFGGAEPLPATTIERRLTECAKSAGIERIRIHDLRHSCATYLIHCKVNIVAVSRQLGHINVEQTLNTYSHALPNDEDEIRASLEAINAL